MTISQFCKRALVSLLHLSLASLAFPAYGQTFPDENGAALQGVYAVDARFSTLIWMDMTQDEARFTEAADRAFELALRRDGVVVDISAPNYLFCTFSGVETPDGLVVYSWRLHYYEWEPEGVHRLLWESGGLVSAGRSRFSPEEVSKDCSDAFALEWLRQNPR